MPLAWLNDPRSQVLLVEADPVLRDLVRLALRRFGYCVRAAGDSATALRLAGESSPDAVVLDLFLPGMGGLDLLRRLKEIPSAASIPVVAISALGFREVVQQALQSGACDFVLKPFDVALLAEKLEQVIQRAKTIN